MMLKILFGLTILLSLYDQIAEGVNCTETPCGFGCESSCDASCYDVLPSYEVIYLSNGDMLEIRVVHQLLPTFQLAREDDGGMYEVVDDDDVCGGDSSVCVLDGDAARFKINSFESSLAGNYEYQHFYMFSDFCPTPFTLIEAIAPTLSKEPDPPAPLDIGDTLTLVPMVTLGTPPGTVTWYKDDVVIATTNNYSKPLVEASDRGVYTIVILHQTGNLSLNYTIYINFPPVVTLTSTSGNGVTVTCQAISYPGIGNITLSLIDGPSIDPEINLNIENTNTLDFKSTAVHTVPECPNQRYRCVVQYEGPTITKELEICQEAPSITSLQIMEVNSSGISVKLVWVLSPPQQEGFEIQYEIEYRVVGESFNTINVLLDIEEFIINNLTPDTEYEFRLKGTHPMAGEGAYSGTENFTTSTAPNIISFQVIEEGSANDSVLLAWMLSPPQSSPVQYEIQYKLRGSGTFITITELLENESFNVTGLSPGMEYEFRIRSKHPLVGLGAYSLNISSVTFSAPQSPPRQVTVRRNMTKIHLTWQQSNSVASYDVRYNTTNTSPQIISVDTNSFTLNNINKSLSYYFSVRSRNQWGTSRYSSIVVYREMIDTTTPILVNITQIQLSDTEVIIDWRITGEDQVSYIEITIHRVTSSSPGEVELYEIYSLTVNNTSTIAQCFNGLNDSDIYQFCVVAVSRDGTRYATCEIRTTTTSDTGLRNTGDCQRVTSQSPVEEVIPSWAIIVIVVGSVVLVFLIFGGCGLYFGLKRSKKGEADFETPHGSFDKLPQEGGLHSINGNYPYPPPAPRAMSPAARNCMNYRHNNHGHHLDWQGVTAV